MQRRFQLSCYVTSDISAAFLARAKARNLTGSSALRQLVINDLFGPAFDPREQRNHILFMAIAMDGLLDAHPDPELRPRLIQIWRDRIAEEEGRHGD